MKINLKLLSYCSIVLFFRKIEKQYNNVFIKHFFFFISFFIFHLSSSSQNLPYARQVIDALCSPQMHGRGYVNDGDKIASQFIANEFQRFGLKYFGENYFQNYKLFVNTFPSEMTVILNEKELVPGRDYIVRGYSGSSHGTFGAVWAKKGTVSNKRKFQGFQAEDFKTKVLIIDMKNVTDSIEKATLNFMKTNNSLGANAVIEITDEKFISEISLYASDVPLILIKREVITEEIKTITIDIKNQMKDPYPSRNVIGYIQGSEKKDSFIVFTAHYDHLGHMGKEAYFPGANDNASGVAMLLNLTEYYTKYPPKYSIAFMSFSGEELGLMGSQAYTRKPSFPLSNIKFLVNLDIVGTGDEGITVVNSTGCPDEFSSLVKINNEKKYLKQLAPRANANNSDHFMFTEKGVKAVFIYTMGGIAAYHDIYDRPETLPLTEFEDIIRLLTDFVQTF